MNQDFSIKIKDAEFLAAYARLKNVPIAKVIRNASRDFTQAAYKETPIARKSKSPYFVFYDRAHHLRFLHQSQLKGRSEESLASLKRVKIARGWSKATWIGIMRQLGMKAKSKPADVPQAATTRSNVQTYTNQDYAQATITDEIRFNRFGQGAGDARLYQIAQAGYRLAAERIEKDTERILKRQWEGRK